MKRSKYIWLPSISILSTLYFFSCDGQIVQNNFLAPTSATSHSMAENINHKNETQEMVEFLGRIVEQSDPKLNAYRNKPRVGIYKSMLSQSKSTDKPSIWYQYCKELLRSGDARQCIQEIENFFEANRDLSEQMTANNYVLFELLAIAYLRLGEQENCQLNHTEFSCILPLEESAIHTLPEGSKNAIDIYKSMYDVYPNQGYKWLINLGYMTLGTYPQEVPKKYLINYPNWNLEQRNFPRFNEVAMNVNTAISGLSGGVCTEDFNNDGLIDIFVTDYGIDAQARLLINNGKGSFDDQTISAGLEGIVGGLNTIQADYNNDGFEDVFVLRGAWLVDQGNHPNSLLKNNGDGTFSDVTKSAGLMSLMPTQTGAWADFNRDGYLDLFIGNESRNNSSNPCELYLNNGDGTFKEVAASVGANVHGFVKGVVWGDINNDSWPDLYISIMGSQNILLKNNEGVFEDVSQTAGVQEPISSFPCWFWDVNNDGYQDIYVSGYSSDKDFGLPLTFAQEMQGVKTNNGYSKLYINNGNETFTDATESYNLLKCSFAMGANFGDLDNDGNLDFYLGTGAPAFNSVIPNRMFRNVDGTNSKKLLRQGGLVIFKKVTVLLLLILIMMAIKKFML